MAYQHTLSTYSATYQHTHPYADRTCTHRSTQGADNPLTIAVRFRCLRARHMAAQVLVQVKEDVSVPLMTFAQDVSFFHAADPTVVVVESPVASDAVHV